LFKIEVIDLIYNLKLKKFMKYLKKFGSFTEAVAAEPATKPAPSPTPAPTTEPGTKPERRERPSPIRRDRPSVEPDPKAKAKAQKKSLKKAKAQDVANRFIELATEEGFDFKKYFPNV
jgi:hypothetical protein